MKIIQTKNNKKIVVIIAAIIIVLLAGSASVYALYKASPSQQPVNERTDTSTSSEATINDDEATQEQIDAGNATKEDTVNNSETEVTPSALNLTVTPSKIGEIVRVEVSIKEIILSGTCTAIVSNGSVSKTYTAEVQALSSYSTCTGFDIPTTDLASGVWTINVTVSSASGDGTVKSEIRV